MAGRLKDAVVVQDAPEDAIMGHLVTFSFHDEPQPAGKVVRTWAAHGLDVNDLPDVRSPTHVFQSACRSVETRRANSTAGVEITVAAVKDDSVDCVYQITRMVRDKANALIEYPKAMTLRLDKSTDTISVVELEDYQALRGLEERIREHFTRHAKDIPGQKIRNAVRDTLLKIGGQNLRGKAGGLYFVPTAYRVDRAEVHTQDVIEGLAGFLDETYGAHGYLYRWPMMDSDYSREIVAKHFALDANAKARDLLEKAVQRAASGTGDRGIREEFMVTLYNEQRRLAAAAQQYDQLVDLERTDLDANLRDLDEAMRKLEKMRDDFDKKQKAKRGK